MTTSTRYALATVAGLCLLLLTTGCQVPLQTRDYENYTGPGAEYFQKEEVEFPSVADPLERMNRGSAEFNDGLQTYIFQPISWVYRTVLPQPLRTGIMNVATNAYYPVRLLGNVLQWNWPGAGRETTRFLANTTVGVGGLWDPATDIWEIEPSEENTGQSFGVWGWEDSTFFMLPILGPSTVRDGLGSIVDAAADPLTYFPPASPIRSVIRNLEFYPQYKQFVETNFDPYEVGRLLYVLSQNLRIDDYDFDLEAEDSPATETLGAVFLAYEDPDFPGRGRNRSASIPSTDREIRYTLWLQDEPGPIIYFLPGTGGHRRGSSSLAIAEIAYNNGRSVVTISSALHADFASASETPLPGYAPVDAEQVHLALDAIHRELAEDYPGRFTKRVLGGLSLGGMHTLQIGARERDDLVDFDAYVAINAPVNLGYAVDKLDGFFNGPLRFPTGEREAWIASVLRKVLYLAGGKLEGSSALPFTTLEAEFLIGLSFRNSLRDVIYQSQERFDQGVLQTERGFWTRSQAYQEILKYSFYEYIYAFVLPYYAERIDGVEYDEAGAQRLLRDCNLRSIEQELRAQSKLRYIGNRNDFVLEGRDAAWLTDTLGEDRVTFFDRGGHLGNLYREEIQAALKQIVDEALSR